MAVNFKNAYPQAAQTVISPDIAVILEPDGFFRAIDRNNYDVDCDHTGFFSTSPTGYGRTPLDAIVDLVDMTYKIGQWGA